MIIMQFVCILHIINMIDRIFHQTFPTLQKYPKTIWNSLFDDKENASDRNQWCDIFRL